MKEIIYDELGKNGFQEDKILEMTDKIITVAKNRL